jgi:hypothetical protein
LTTPDLIEVRFLFTINLMNTTASADLEVISQLVLTPGETLSRASAEAILAWHFSDAAKQEMRELREKNGEGTITPAEYSKLDSYRRVGNLLDRMRAEAKLALRGEAANP